MKKTHSQGKLIAALICAVGLRLSFFPDATGLVSLSLTVALAIVVLSLMYIPWLKGFRWLTVLRDTGIVFGVILLLVGSTAIVSVLLTGAEAPPNGVVAVVGIIAGSVGFLIAGLLTRSHRLSHLAHVAVVVWLGNGLQLLLDPASWKPWLLSFFITCSSMWVGFGLSCLLRSPERPDTNNPAEEVGCPQRG